MKRNSTKFHTLKNLTIVCKYTLLIKVLFCCVWGFFCVFFFCINCLARGNVFSVLHRTLSSILTFDNYAVFSQTWSCTGRGTGPCL